MNIMGTDNIILCLLGGAVLVKGGNTGGGSRKEMQVEGEAVRGGSRQRGRQAE